MASYVGTEGDNVFNGGAGNDTANGKGGNDTLTGNGGNDVLQGGTGADTLDGGLGNDSLYSFSRLGKYQTPYSNGNYVAPVLDRGTEVDTLRGGDGADLLSAGYGDNVDGGDDIDTLFISFQGATSGVTIDFRQASQIVGGAMIENVESVAWVEGSNHDDVITDGFGSPDGTFGAMFGMGGNDTLVAGYYTGSLNGGDGNDLLDGNGSQYLSVLDGGAGDDILYERGGLGVFSLGGDGNDTIYAGGNAFGGAGNDKIVVSFSYYGGAIHGDDGDDELIASQTGYANGNSQTLFGDAGNDTLRGGAGNDLFDGGAGNDTIIGGGETGPNPIYGGPTADVAVYTGRSTDYLLTQDPTTQIITVIDRRAGSLDGTDTLDGVELMKFTDGTYLTSAVLAGIGLGVGDFVGGDNDDVFIGNEDSNTGKGNGGNDALNGNGGNDVLEGGAGRDTLDGGAGSDNLHSVGPLGNWSPPYYNGPFIAPSLDRAADIDTLRGGDGQDTLSAGYGDNIDGGNGADTLFVSFLGGAAGVTVDFRLATQITGGATIANVESVAWVEGTNFDDTIIDGLGSPSGTFGALFGMGGSDTLVAGYYTGALFGGDGDDTIDGRSSQYLRTIDGGAGDDVIYDTLNGSATSRGNEGNDTIYSNGDTFGGAGNDKIVVTSSYSFGSFHGDDGDDELIASPTGYANGYSPTLFGDAGNDTLRGGAGNDLFDGGAGDDTIIGGGETGPNPIYGGPMADVAVYTGRSTDYLVTQDPTTQVITLIDQRAGSPDGTDTLSGVELMQFSDGTYLTSALFGETITGTNSDDTLVGTSGNDVINPLLGNDTVDGGGGTDALNVDYSSVTSFRYGQIEIGGGSYTGQFDGAVGVGSSSVEFNNVEVVNAKFGTDNDFLRVVYLDEPQSRGLVFDGGAGLDGVELDLSRLSSVNFVGGGDQGNFGLFRNVEAINVILGSGTNSAIMSAGSEYVISTGGIDTIDMGAGLDRWEGNLESATITGTSVSGSNGTTVVGVEEIRLQATDVVTDLAVFQYLTTANLTIDQRTVAGDQFSIEGSEIYSANLQAEVSGDLIIRGGFGDNRVGFAKASGNVSIDGGAGNDALVMSAQNSNDFDIIAENGGYSLINNSFPSGTSNTLFIKNIEEIEFDDVTISLSAGQTFIGTALGETLTGTAFHNILIGLGGNDTLLGGLGDDLLNGGTGNDILNGGEGIDTASYADATRGVQVNLALTAIQGTFDGRDTLIEIENLTGSDFADILRGDGGSNILDGGLRNDSLFGFGGVDTLIGGAGADRLDGGDDADLLIGGLGNDVLFGGAGADIFLFDALTGPDTIRDFVSGEDKIMLDRSVFATLGGDTLGALELSAFHVGTKATSVDHHLIYNDANGALFYDADGLGGIAQIRIATLTGQPELVASDFLLGG